MKTVSWHGIITERLSLSRPATVDLEPVFAIHADPRTYGYGLGEPHDHLDRTREMFDIIEEQWENDGFGYWVVRSRDTDEVIGTGGLRRIIFDDRPVLNLYYRFAPAVWGRGFATELARACVDLAERDLPELPVIARVHPDNKPSIAVAERAGLMNLGIHRRDGYRMVVLSTRPL